MRLTELATLVTQAAETFGDLRVCTEDGELLQIVWHPSVDGCVPGIGEGTPSEPNELVLHLITK